MVVVKKDDFIGPFAVVRDPKSDINLQSFIDINEVPTLTLLLGEDLATLFIADLVAGVPQSARFLALFNAFLISWQDVGFDYGCNAEWWNACYRKGYIESKGMKNFLLAQIFYLRACKRQISDSQSGFQQSATENSSVINTRGAMRIGENIFNEFLPTANAIQYKCLNDTTTYPEYKGVGFEVKYASLF